MNFNINSLSLTSTIISIILLAIISYLVIFTYKKYAKNSTITKNELSSNNEYKNNIEVTKEIFDKIKNGMPYEEVVDVIGGEGEIISESGQKGDKFYIVMYKYKGVGDVAANVNLIFQGGKLINKSQVGLK